MVTSIGSVLNLNNRFVDLPHLNLEISFKDLIKMSLYIAPSTLQVVHPMVIQGGDPRTGTFHQMRITADGTTCSVKWVYFMVRVGPQMHML